MRRDGRRPATKGALVLGWDAVVDARRLAFEASRSATRTVLGHEFPRTAADNDFASSVPMAELLGLLSADRTTVAELVEAYEVAYVRLAADGVTVRPGWSKLVAAARPLMSIAVLALEEQHLVEVAAVASGVGAELDLLVCATGSPERPPHPGSMLAVIAGCGAVPATSVYVATTAAEVAASRSCGVFTAVLRTGAPGSSADPSTEHLVPTIDRLDELVELLGLRAAPAPAAPAEPPGASPRGTDRSR